MFERPDGGISVDVPVSAVADDPDALAAHIANLEAVHGWTHRETTTADALPSAQAGQSRRFRGCWRWTGSAVAADLPLARAQLMAELRDERNRRLEVSDGKQLRANESGTAQDQADWNTHRQALRDLPVTVQAEVDALTTATDLEAHAVTWPSEPE